MSHIGLWRRPRFIPLERTAEVVLFVLAEDALPTDSPMDAAEQGLPEEVPLDGLLFESLTLES